MRTMIRAATISRILPALMFASFAAAAADWSVSVAGGATRADTSKLAQQHAVDFPFASRTSGSESSGAWRVAAGRFFSPQLSIEASYSDYGRQKLEVSGSPNPIVFPEEVLSEARSSERQVTAWGLDLVVRVPVSGNLSVLASLGGAYATVKLDSRTVATAGFPFGSGPKDASFTARERSFAPRLALGGAWIPAPEWELQLTYEYLDSVGSDFAQGAQDRTGRSNQSTGWLTLMRRF